MCYEEESGIDLKMKCNDKASKAKMQLEEEVTNMETLPSDLLLPQMIPSGGSGSQCSTTEPSPPVIRVEIICNLHHDELKPLSCVSSNFRDAVLTARQMHFDFSTPVRVQGPKCGANLLMPKANSENPASTVEGLEYLYSSARRLATPSAPKRVGKFQKPQLFSEDTMEKMPKDEFLLGTPAKTEDAMYPSQSYSLRSSCSATGRVLFVEDELCEAIF